ncbi:hypothetical protein J6590_014989 [Homalodisca vitripennis]|nr:hypothetical protein J6590_014989 [Homalodisca vitripennis]
MLNNILNLLRTITLEPSMMLYYTACAMTFGNGQNLLLQKICHPGDSHPSSTTCQDEVHAQQLSTQLQTWKQIIVLFGPVFFVLFAGPWSDNHGKRRKPLLYLPLCGQILSDLLCIVNVYFWSWSPVIATLSESILPSLTGGQACFLIGVNSYISDITTDSSRTIRLGLCTAIYFLGTPLGAFIYGLVVHTIGFYGVFSVCVVLNLVALVYLYLFVIENKCDGEICELNTWEGLLDMRNIVQSFRTIITPRRGWRRAVILIMIGVAPLTMAPLQGVKTTKSTENPLIDDRLILHSTQYLIV